MPTRKPMLENSVFHIFNRSIAQFEIFRDEKDFERFIWMIRFFSIPQKRLSFSKLRRDYKEHHWREKIQSLAELFPSEIQIIAYCLMPTHFHLVVFQKKPYAISKFIKKLLASYTQYVNLKRNRKGPLWEGRFKHVLCETDEQLIHLTRYVHLNPVTAYLEDKPENWFASSYNEYLAEQPDMICNWDPFLKINSQHYKEFTENRVEYQRSLAKIKNLMLD